MLFRCFFPRRIPLLILFVFLLLLLLLQQPASAQAVKTYFPEFNSIENNVRFWERVYGEFSVNTAVFHDRNDLSIIYEAVPLLDRTLPGASRLNRAYLKKVHEKYETILINLANGQRPVTGREKRVFSMFTPPGVRDKLRRAAGNIRIQSGLKERFLDGVIRSGAYIGEMKDIFSSYGLPEDLAYLPHVESSFNTKAYSKRGAAGMWQFTRATGKRYMRIDSIVDERLDPIKATHAAAQYLKRNFANLGTWPLAITAYNYGHAGMMRAVKQEKNYENIFHNYNQGHFKFASRNFYSEFLAAVNVAKRLERSPRLILDKPGAYLDFILPTFADAKELAEHFGFSAAALAQHNPALLRPVWYGEKFIPKGYHLRLPNTQKTLRLARTVPRELFRQSQKRAQMYTVRTGDTAGKIARRFGISLRRLSEANSLDSRAMVYVGQRLRIPSTGAPLTGNDRRSGKEVVVLRASKKSPPT